MQINIKPCKISTSFKAKKIYPELEDIVIIPMPIEQHFKSKKYGFDNVVVKAIQDGNVSIDIRVDGNTLIINPSSVEEDMLIL